MTVVVILPPYVHIDIIIVVDVGLVSKMYPPTPLPPPPTPFVGWVMGCSSEAIECSRTCQTHPSAVGTENDNWVETGHRQNKLICWHLLLANICVCSAAGGRVCCPMLGMMWWQTSGTRGPLNFFFHFEGVSHEERKEAFAKMKKICWSFMSSKNIFLCDCNCDEKVIVVAHR